ncbi:uncharacterized protein LOC122048795 [Zingiber officinale]|uniref:uncharacterized protein LOC122048795 n=1 Tax=Zingiber officinale TaxID=94328 RepID=UPI001C4B9753|nr:uncharacterized protein LOC122048795 [Zingiber officinale]
MARTRALLPLFIWLSAVAAAPSPSPTEDCSSALLSLSGCLSFVEQGSSEARPQKRCCSGLNEVAGEQESCLCVAFSQGAAMGFRINMTRALALPSYCAVSVPPLADCKVAPLGGGPAGAPSPSLGAAIAPSPLAGQSSNAAAATVSVAALKKGMNRPGRPSPLLAHSQIGNRSQWQEQEEELDSSLFDSVSRSLGDGKCVEEDDEVGIDAVGGFALAVVAAANKVARFPYPATDSIVSYLGCKKMFRQIKLGRGGRPSSWIQSIPASSPTQIKEGAAALTASHGGGGDYERWLELHPSALDNFEEVMSSSKGNQIVMFLDYDGTLSLIVDDPDCAFMSDEMREAVRDVASHFPTAIVSRRCREKARYCARTRILAVKFLPLPSTFGSGARSILDQVSSFVRLSELYHAGSHGMDIKGPIHGHRHTEAKAKSVLFQPASEFLPMIDEVYKKLVETTKCPWITSGEQ